MIWIYANMSLDQEEKLENICSRCKEKMKLKRCSCCGEELEKAYDEKNSNFNNSVFKLMDENGGGESYEPTD